MGRSVWLKTRSPVSSLEPIQSAANENRCRKLKKPGVQSTASENWCCKLKKDRSSISCQWKIGVASENNDKSIRSSMNCQWKSALQAEMKTPKNVLVFMWQYMVYWDQTLLNSLDCRVIHCYNWGICCVCSEVLNHIEKAVGVSVTNCTTFIKGLQLESVCHSGLHMCSCCGTEGPGLPCLHIYYNVYIHTIVICGWFM